MDLKNTKNQIIIAMAIIVLILACYIIYSKWQTPQRTIPLRVEDAEPVDYIDMPDAEDTGADDAVTEVKIPKKIHVFEKYRNREYSLREASKRFKASRRGFLTEYNEYLKKYAEQQANHRA